MTFIIDEILNNINECDGGGAIGDGGGISSGDVLGPDGNFENGNGCLGKDDFHIPFPVMPCLFRWKSNELGSNKKRKNKKNKKSSTIKNPYIKGMKIIIAEDETNIVHYIGTAKEEFDKIVGSNNFTFTNVLRYNDQLKLAWMIREDGTLHMYKPFNTGNFWTIYATSLLEDGMIMLDYKAGRYPNEQTALDAIYKAAKVHEQKLQECLNNK
jgi:hypothetical protein